ncbi:unnamed protein product [Clonostachys rhizophaga]|uniref:Uncharacterized protein n=1 Tax=Clonostachys rhizophaga TaxID=160324 RepID=A0A9N9VGG5_9HYPO|nr:unnamed protein product [Clonostachys rhizophaga]
MPRKLPTTFPHPPAASHNPAAVCTHCLQDSEGTHHAGAMQDATSVASQVVETADEHASDTLSSEPVIFDMEDVESVGSDTESSGSHMFATALSPSALADALGWWDLAPPASGGTADVSFPLGSSGSPPAPRRQDSVSPKPWSGSAPSSSDLSDAGFTLVPRPAPAALSNQECSDDVGFVDSTQGVHAVCGMLDALHISASLAKSKTVVNRLESIDRTTSKAASPPPESHLPDSPTLPQMFCDLPQGDGHLAVPSLGTPLGESDADADGCAEGSGVLARRRRRRRAPRAPKASMRAPTVPGSSLEPACLTRDEGAPRVLSRRRPAPEDDSDEALNAPPRPKRRRRGQAAHAWRTIPPLPYTSLRPPPESRL